MTATSSEAYDESGSSGQWPRIDRLAVGMVLLLPLLLAWPLPIAWPDALISDAAGEGVRHVWGWWASAQQTSLLGGETGLLGAPDSVWSPVIDPTNALVAWLPLTLVGPGAALAMVVWVGLVVSGLAGLLLARESGVGPAGQRIGAVVGATVPGVFGAVVDGTFEGLGAGWVGLQLAMLLAVLRRPSWGHVAGLAVCLTAAIHSGPYNAVWCALLDGVVGTVMLRRTWRHIVAGVGATAISMPFFLLALQQDPNQPGGRLRTEPQDPLPVVPWRGAWREGADLMDLLLPVWATDQAHLAATAYLGLATVGCALIGFWRWTPRRRSAWPWAVGAAAFATLALGPFVVAGGDVVVLNGHRLVMPAGLFEELPVLNRLSRWYRAGAVSVLLMAPLAARAVPARWWWAVATLIVLEARLGAPVPAPLPTRSYTVSSPLTGLEGPFAELPDIHPLGDRRFAADDNLIHQLSHGQSLGRARDDVASGGKEHSGLAMVRRAWRLRDGPEAERLAEAGGRGLWRSGFQHLVLYPDRLPGLGRTNLERALGPPVVEAEGLLVYRLRPRGDTR